MGTKEKGDVAETAVLHALVRHGYKVLIPYGENHRYDLVVDVAGNFIRIQVKAGRVRNGCIKFQTFSVTTQGTKDYRGAIDFFMVYVVELDKVYIIHVDEAPTGVGHLRIDSPKLNDPRIKYAVDYEFTGAIN